MTRGAAPSVAAAGGRSWVANALVAALIAAVTVMGGGIVALLVHEFDSIDARFAAQDTKIDARFAAQDAKIDGLGAKIDEIDLKLTALIAALNKTDEVDAARSGRLLDPGTAEADGSAAVGR
jgi:colicin import membrane protein